LTTFKIKMAEAKARIKIKGFLAEKTKK